MAEPRKPPRPAPRAPARPPAPPPSPRTPASTPQPPIGRYPDWRTKNPIRMTEAEGDGEGMATMKRGGRAGMKSGKSRKR